MYVLSEYLNLETKDMLLRRLNTLGCSGTSSLKKDEIINTYIKYIAENACNIWSRLDPLSQQVISESVYDHYTYDKFVAKYKKEPVFSVRGKSYYYRDLTLLGALFFNNERVLPQCIKIAFKPYATEPKAYQLPVTNMLPDNVTERCSEIDAVKELQKILMLVENKSLKVSSKTNMPSKATILLVNEVLSGGDYYEGVSVEFDDIGDIRAIGWLFLLLAGKLIKTTGSSLSITPKGKKALKGPPEEVLKELWSSWINTKLLDEFSRIHNIKGQGSKGAKRSFTSPITRREKIDQVLKNLPVNQWVNIDDLLDFMLINNFNVNVLGNIWDLYIANKQYGNLGQNSNSIDIVRSSYFICVLFEYAATLGIIDIGFVSPVDERIHDIDVWGSEGLSFISRYDGLSYIRVTELGQYILGLSTDFKMSLPDAHVEISSKGTVTINAIFILLPLKEVFDRFFEIISDCQWLITEKSLSNALQTGNKITTLKSTLKNHNVKVPKEISNILNMFHENSKQIKLKDKLFLYECHSRELISIIMKNRKIPHTVKLGDNLIAIPEKSKDRFVDEMLKQGLIIST